MPIKLTHRDLGGSGLSPLIILHGLMGSSRNWQTLGRELSQYYHVFALDLRNHGTSPHSAEMTYADMAEDVILWMQSNHIENATILGHSMGGKVAMVAACRYPSCVTKLIVVDIAPKAYYWPAHRSEFSAMKKIDLNHIATRLDAEKVLELDVPSLALRKFLVTNLEKTQDGNWQWIVNLDVITKAVDHLESNPLAPAEQYLGPTCFIVGGKSNYVKIEDEPSIKSIFPQAQIVTLHEAGHNPHMDSKDAFLKAIKDFIS
jgi:pimeloyl-ACP methyl ester carboxylesterase